jgi:3',5'-cyclic AMP phosphodiesterase CpdA
LKEDIDMPDKPKLSFGVIADLQYADKDTDNDREYRMSIQKLYGAIEYFNSRNPDFIMLMGDVIDGGFDNFARPLEILKQMPCPVRMIAGNHDYNVSESRLAEVHDLFGMPEGYCSFHCRGLRFIVLDGNEISVFAHPRGSRKRKTAESILKSLKARGADNAFEWNGAIGPVQLAWLKRELADAERFEEPVILCSHYPVYPPNPHNLWDDHEILAALDGSTRVKAFLSGHNHLGNYSCRNGIHFLTFAGMVDFKSTAFSYVEIYEGYMRITGFGRESSRVLTFLNEDYARKTVSSYQTQTIWDKCP